MTALDSSVVIAAFATWHERHEQSVGLLRDDCVIPTQVAVETFSVLTRLPPPHRAPAPIVTEFLRHHFGRALIDLPKSKYPDVLSMATSNGLLGGSVYDALIAATVKHTGARLLSLDKRAIRTYSIVGVDHELISGSGQTSHAGDPDLWRRR